MAPDDFAHSSISNLYYDTPDFRMIRRSLEKPKYKEKLRLTLDRNILWRTEMLDLSRGIWGEQLLEPDQTLMEIKISNAMPLWLAEALSECSVYPTSFSKYGRAYQTMFRRLFTGEEVKQYA